MRRMLLAATAVYLAACSGPTEGDRGPKAGDPGTYSRNLADGTPVTVMIREDGSILRRVGDTIGVGTVRTDGKQTCFDFTGDNTDEYCWTNGPIRNGGTFESTGPDGEILIVTYSPEVFPKGATMTAGLYAIGDGAAEYGRSQINADGTYIDFADEREVGRGTWQAEGERACFDPEGNEDHQQQRCWINGPADADGSFQTTREDGSTSYLVTPITQ